MNSKSKKDSGKKMFQKVIVYARARSLDLNRLSFDPQLAADKYWNIQMTWVENRFFTVRLSSLRRCCYHMGGLSLARREYILQVLWIGRGGEEGKELQSARRSKKGKHTHTPGLSYSWLIQHSINAGEWERGGRGIPLLFHCSNTCLINQYRGAESF